MQVCPRHGRPASCRDGHRQPRRRDLRACRRHDVLETGRADLNATRRSDLDASHQRRLPASLHHDLAAALPGARPEGRPHDRLGTLRSRRHRRVSRPAVLLLGRRRAARPRSVGRRAGLLARARAAGGRGRRCDPRRLGRDARASAGPRHGAGRPRAPRRSRHRRLDDPAGPRRRRRDVAAHRGSCPPPASWTPRRGGAGRGAGVAVDRTVTWTHEPTGERRTPPAGAGGVLDQFGDDLLSQGVSPQVPSALAVLTSVFGMGTGVALPVWSPKPVVKDGAATCMSRRAALRALQSKHEHDFNQALGRLVPVSSTRCRAYTSGLST